jgi:DNA repair photolyase
MIWDKIIIRKEDNTEVEAQAPMIISASRATDIPTFYCDWFFHRLEVGYSAWTNPFNGVKSYVSYKNTRLIVFWSKDPKPLLTNNYLNILKEKNINCYIQFSLNDYVKEGLERGVPCVDERIDTFISLVEQLGKGKVIWRFDPLLLTDSISIDDLLKKAEYIGNKLKGYNEKMVFSYADIASYRKVKKNLMENHINYKEFSQDDMLLFAQEISKLNRNWNYQLATCAEILDLEKYGIAHNKCIDDDLMIKYFSNDKILMDFLGVKFSTPDLFSKDKTMRIEKTKNNKDKGQRKACGCIISKDIGEYNTCPHFCEYCYANDSKEKAKNNWKQHLKNRYSETIIGE